MIGGVLTGGLAPGSSGVSYIPTWGLYPGSAAPRPTRVFRLRGSLRAAFPLRGSLATAFFRRGSFRTAFRLRGSLSMCVTSFIEFSQGEAVAVPYAIDGAPVLTGMTLTFTLFNADGSTALSLSVTPDTGLTAGPLPVPVAQVGTALVRLTRAQTAALAAGSYAVEGWRTDAGSEARFANGAFEVKASLAP